MLQLGQTHSPKLRCPRRQRWPKEPARPSVLPAARRAPGRAANWPGPGGAAERPATSLTRAGTDLTDTHLCISVPLGPAPPLLFLVPLGLLLSPGAPQTLPLCLNSHQLLLCSPLQEKKRQVSPSPTTATALPTAGWRHRAGEPKPLQERAGKEPGPLSYRSRRQEPEMKKERGSLPPCFDGGGPSRRTAGEAENYSCYSARAARRNSLEHRGSRKPGRQSFNNLSKKSTRY